MTGEVLDKAGKRGSISKNNAGRMVQNLRPGKTFTAVDIKGDDTEARDLTITLMAFGGPHSEIVDDEEVDIPCPLLRAVLKWGQDGAMQECEVDWRNGTVLTVHASSVSLVIENLEPEEGGRSANVGAFVAYGSRSSVTSNTISMLAVSGEGNEVMIPPFAQRVNFLFVSAVGDVTFLDGASAPICIANLDPSWQSAPIPNNARYVAVEGATILIFDLPF